MRSATEFWCEEHSFELPLSSTAREMLFHFGTEIPISAITSYRSNEAQELAFTHLLKVKIACLVIWIMSSRVTSSPNQRSTMKEIKYQAPPVDAVWIGPHTCVCTRLSSSEAHSVDLCLESFALLASSSTNSEHLGPLLPESRGTPWTTLFLCICTVPISYKLASFSCWVWKEEILARATDIAGDCSSILQSEPCRVPVKIVFSPSVITHLFPNVRLNPSTTIVLTDNKEY